ncbi:MAG: TolC family protein [Deltaproteobacteria bacterium]|nr:TolC family protein [Deltaproteobacteria bacterium]
MKTIRATIVVAAVLLAVSLAANVKEVASPATPKVKIITLKQSQEMAARNNPSLKNVGETVYQADKVINSAWSMLLPNLSAKGNLIRNQKEIALDFPDPSAMDPSDTDPPDTDEPIPTQRTVIQEKWGKSFGFTANMTLFNARSIPLIKYAYDDADRTRLKAKRLRNDLLFAVTNAYYQVNSMREMIAVQEENLNIAKEFHRLSLARVQAGQSTSIDVLRAEIRVMDAQKGLANAEDAHRMAKTGLSYLIGIEGEYEVAGPEQVKSVEGDLEKLKNRALKDRVDIKEAEMTEKMAARLKNETWMKWIPVFDVTYDWSWNSAAGFAGENDSWMLIFGAKWSLLEGGGRIAELKTRESQIRMAKNSLDQLTLDIKQNVEQSYLDVNKQKRNVDFADKQVALAEENHKLIARQFEVGLATSLDLLTAATELATKRNTRVMERLQYDIAMLTLRKVMGEYHSLSNVEPR